ncbi:MAG: hypothetical protein ACOZQL_29425 [Myxococcota bacterium]
MSPVRHEHLHDALHALERALALGDALAAEQEMSKALERFAATPGAHQDERLLPIYERCQRLALELRESLAAALRGSARSSRAAQAYEREAGGAP